VLAVVKRMGVANSGGFWKAPAQGQQAESEPSMPW
jgi:hypothetical protein